MTASTMNAARGLPSGADDEQYQALSIPAVAALLLGIASPLAFLHPLLWTAPLLALGVSLYALYQIRRYAPGLTGRRAAQLGLALAVVCGTGAAVHAGIERVLTPREADRVARLWFGYVRSGDLYKAHQMTLDSRTRLPFREDLATTYAEIPKLKEQFDEFAATNLVRELRQLPPDARVTLKEIERHDAAGNHDRLQLLYTVAVPGGESFQVSVILHRFNSRLRGGVTWQIVPLARVRAAHGVAEAPPRSSGPEAGTAA
jgi:hypothetical protein